MTPVTFYHYVHNNYSSRSVCLVFSNTFICLISNINQGIGEIGKQIVSADLIERDLLSLLSIYSELR